MRVAWQILKEFWLPSVVALVWAFYRVRSQSTVSISDIIANVGTSFFLASWAMGQIIRIKRQQAVEQSFERTEANFNELRKTMESMVGIATESRELAKSVPGLERKLEQISTLARTADRQATETDDSVIQTLRAVAARQPAGSRRQSADRGISVSERIRLAEKGMMSPPPPPP
jgi:hypothetical protein